jgi:hypothetical protein
MRLVGRQFGIKRRVAQRDIEVELADIKDLVHYSWAPAEYEHTVNKRQGQGVIMHVAGR